MLIVEIAIKAIVLLLLALLVRWQIRVQIAEWRFYKARNWDFSVDSGMDRIEERITYLDLGLSNRQRLYVFRPAYITLLIGFTGLLIASAML